MILLDRAAGAAKRVKSAVRGDAAWYALSTALPALVTIAMGPLVLRKVGLEEYALLGLATYFLGLILAYSDFGSYSHLLASFAKGSTGRHADLASALLLKIGLWSIFWSILQGFAIWSPRKDDLYALLTIFMLGLLFSSANTEWYFISQRRYRQIFTIRALMAGIQVALTLGWFFSRWKSALAVPTIYLISGAGGSLATLWFLKWGAVQALRDSFHRVTWQGFRELVIRILPMAATLLVAPYFLAYSLPWFSLATPDKKLVGAFSIAYRIIMGTVSLIAPFVTYMIPRSSAASKPVQLGTVFKYSMLMTSVFWTLGVPVVWFYFRAAKVDPGLFGTSTGYFSILMLGVFFNCLRIPYVSRSLFQGRYRAFFVLHAVACIPLLIISWMMGKRVHSDVVPWLACLPDFFATVGFIWYSRREVRSAS